MTTYHRRTLVCDFCGVTIADHKVALSHGEITPDIQTFNLMVDGQHYAACSACMRPFHDARIALVTRLRAEEKLVGRRFYEDWEKVGG